MGHLKINLESLWNESVRVRLKKETHSRIDFNHLIKLRSERGVDSVLLWGQFWHMNVTLGALWGHFGATLGI